MSAIRAHTMECACSPEIIHLLCYSHKATSLASLFQVTSMATL